MVISKREALADHAGDWPLEHRNQRRVVSSAQRFARI